MPPPPCRRGGAGARAAAGAAAGRATADALRGPACLALSSCRARLSSLPRSIAAAAVYLCVHI